ncbi:MAG: purine-nucleoside phosphorylase [Pseudonocardiales bacterium]|nr:purine-nucleoside phosphorylase [Pseudonocardiales bacterium]
MLERGGCPGRAGVAYLSTGSIAARLGSDAVNQTTQQHQPEDSADPARLAAEAARALAERTGAERHDVALVLGSGWLPAVDALGGRASTDVEFASTELPGFSPPAVAGHAGTIRSLALDGKRLLIFSGRTHYYEGRGVAAVVHGVRVAAAAGCTVTVLTNGCGGLREDMQVGDPVLISDHLNLTFTSPLVGPRFVDLTDLYSPRLRALMREIDPSLAEGVYAQFPGPHYESPAEVRMARVMGADLVGMSTALEAIAARAEGSEVLGISLVTNLAAGITGQPLNHEEVLAAGKAAAARAGGLLGELIGRL